MNPIKLHKRENILRDVWTDFYGNETHAIALCPKCKCEIERSSEGYISVYKYRCIQCDFSIILDTLLKHKADHFLKILQSQKYKDAEIVNIDGDLIRIQRQEVKDSDYWIDAKISKDKKGNLQLMVLAGSKKTKDKVQLFLDPSNEKLSFDQNDSHPKEIFSKVLAIFKDSNSEIKLDSKEESKS